MAIDIKRTIEAVWRMESLRLVAALARTVRDVSLAEDLAQDALVIALEQWPTTGIPENPGAWLMTTAKRRGIDLIRRREMIGRKQDALAHEMETQAIPSPLDLAEAEDEAMEDDTLRLLFVAAHPVLPTEARLAFTLRMVGGLTTAEVARAFLTTEAAIAQRIVRAKRALAEAGVPFEVPRGEDRRARVGSVLEVIYLIFNEGYTATSGDAWMRPNLCLDAMRLGRILCELEPQDSEAHGLIALMELQASRMAARVTAAGEPVLLQDQNRALWDHLLIRRGLAALAKARQAGPSLGPYALQAAIAACHAKAVSAADTDWAGIVALYSELAALSPSPVVFLNCAVAVGMAFGPAAALALVDELSSEPALENYYLLPCVRADLLLKTGRTAEAVVELRRAADLTQNSRERGLLLARAQKHAGPIAMP